MLYYHGGRTDSNGGHRDRINGGYHYHHGESAHHHPNGICEYEAYDYDYSSSNSFDGAVFFSFLFMLISWKYNIYGYEKKYSIFNFIEYVFIFFLWGGITLAPLIGLFFWVLPNIFSYEEEYSLLFLIPIIIYLEIRERRKRS